MPDRLEANAPGQLVGEFFDSARVDIEADVDGLEQPRQRDRERQPGITEPDHRDVGGQAGE